MIITVTMNPAIDRTAYIDQLQAGELNRIQHTETDAGGKGINVSRVLKTLGIPSIAIALVGGDAGALLEKKLQALAIHTDFVHISGSTRINEKIIEQNGRMTEFNEPGPVVTAAELAAFEEKLLTYAKKPEEGKSGGKDSGKEDSGIGDADIGDSGAKNSSAKNSGTKDASAINAGLKESDIKRSDAKSADLNISDVKGSGAKSADLNISDVKGSGAKSADLNISDVKGSGAKSADLNISDVKGSGARNSDVKNCANGNLFVISGSMPRGIAPDYYQRLIRKLHAAGAAVLLDADGTLFKAGMEAHPDIIKPNARELLTYFDLATGHKSQGKQEEGTSFSAEHRISDGEYKNTTAGQAIQKEEHGSSAATQPIREEDLIVLAHRLRSEGQKFFAISLGKDGALFCGERNGFSAHSSCSDAAVTSSIPSSSDAIEFLRCPGLPVHAQSPVGAGDAMVAALAYGWQQQLSLEETARLAMACSAGAATTEGTRPPTRLIIDALLPKVEIKRI